MKACIKCGSHAFNLYAEEIDQGGLCDVHYWQGRAHRAEALAQPDAFEQGRQEGMKQERALWELSKLGQEIEAQPEEQQSCDKQEPVAWMYTSQLKGNERFITRYQSELTTYKADKVWPLYTSPPPQRPWVGLTDEEKQEWIDAMPYDIEPRHCMILVNVIEAKLKEKNT